MIEARTELERLLLSQPDVQQGLRWGKSRRGHPEGIVGLHVQQILDRIDQLNEPNEVKEQLRLMAILHDTFKYKVDISKPRTGENNHAVIARHFAERFIQDGVLLDMIEFHDKYYSIWLTLTKKGFFREREFHAMARRLRNLPLFLKFVWLDGSVEGKSPEPHRWFDAKLKEYSYL